MGSKLLGGILLIVGTSIGAGMLALPIATAELGFAGAFFFLVFCWLIMTIGAFLLLEVNLWLPLNSNLISMAGATLGPLGQIVAWLTYLLLLYSLLCAYISGGSDLFHGLLTAAHLNIPGWLATVLFTAIFGTIVYLGIQIVDYVNRVLMFTKLGAYFLLVVLLVPFVAWINLKAGNIKAAGDATALTVTITSFGYAAIIPSLRIYFASQTHALKKAILIGSLIPLICYIIWDAVIMGVIPLSGGEGLEAILKSGGSTTSLVNTLSNTTSSDSISIFTHLFTSICMLTSFLGVALCLVDFLSDGLSLEKKGGSTIVLHLLTFIPPLVIDLFFPKIFITALQYAGIYCIILLVLFPAMMAWRGRYHKKLPAENRVMGGKVMLAFLIILSILLIIWGIADGFM